MIVPTDDAHHTIGFRSGRWPVLRELSAESIDLLLPFFESGAFATPEAQLIGVFARLDPTTQPLALLALATASRGARVGHSCIDLSVIADVGSTLLPTDADSGLATNLPWPGGDQWSSVLANSPIVATPDDAVEEPLRPLVFDGQRIYLQRYWVHESRVAHQLQRRANTQHTGVREDAAAIEPILSSLFGPVLSTGDDRQRQAAAIALKGGLSIITGGPGTGKTFTIARILAGAQMLARAEGRSLNVALAAPTGKAAARITESISGAIVQLAEMLPSHNSLPEVLHATQGSATTIHQLLGFAPGDKFRHDRNNPLPHDMVIIDEFSMVSLSLMSRLLEAVRPDASLVLVGDPDQLASVDVGTVLSDIIGTTNPVAPVVALSGGLRQRITVLDSGHRFGSNSPIAVLANAVRSGNFDATMMALRSANDVEWVLVNDTARVRRLTDEVINAAVISVGAALNSDPVAALDAARSVKVLAATRMHTYGLHHWSDLIQTAVGDRVGIDNSHSWFVGRPVIITANDRVNRVANGDTGVVVSYDGALRVAMPEMDGIRYISPSRLAEVESWWAMTIHKSQGSEFDHVVVSLPPAGSPVLTRELLYTAITRAKKKVTVLASEESIREAIQRPVSRASGLRSRLWLQ